MKRRGERRGRGCGFVFFLVHRPNGHPYGIAAQRRVFFSKRAVAGSVPFEDHWDTFTVGEEGVV